MTKPLVSQLPEAIQEQVRTKLRAYYEAYVERENGQYRYVAGAYLDTSAKADDYAFYTYTQDDAFTTDEQADNFKALVDSHPSHLPDSFWN